MMFDRDRLISAFQSQRRIVWVPMLEGTHERTLCNGCSWLSASAVASNFGLKALGARRNMLIPLAGRACEPQDQYLASYSINEHLCCKKLLWIMVCMHQVLVICCPALLQWILPSLVSLFPVSCYIYCTPVYRWRLRKRWLIRRLLHVRHPDYY